MNVLDAEKSFASLVDRVHREGISIDLERDNEVVARLTPSGAARGLKASDLAAFLQTLPSLGDDAESFARGILEIRDSAKPETNPWD